jgi:prepilin-type N-terminal cleavage/methylation domain-containing protein
MTRRLSRRGLTLIELIVVLMILIALAGLLVPTLPSMLSRTHDATCATNCAETAKAIVIYQNLYGQYPNNWDALGDGTQIIDYFANGSAFPGNQGGMGMGMSPGNGEPTALTLTSAEASALTAVGIGSVQRMVPSANGAPAGFDPTFNYYAAVTPTAGALSVSQGTVLAGLDPTNAANTAAVTRCVKRNLPLTGRYVALGVGPRNGMIGKTAQSAPVMFADMPMLNPAYGYQRYVALFKVSDTAAGTNFTQAQLVGVGPVMDTGLGDIDDRLQNWYQLTNGGS